MANIVETAIGAGSFSTLVAAVLAAGLAETLSGEGPFTVFAPNDEAFTKVDPATLDHLLTPEGRDTLIKILTYHVVAGKHMAADVAKLETIKTLEGGSLVVDVSEGVTVDDAIVIAADIEADNGVIHVIDTVLIPE